MLLETVTAISMLAAPSTDVARCKPVVAAYPSWKAAAAPAATLPWDRFNHLAVVFAQPLADGTLRTADVDGLLTEIVPKAHRLGKKVILDIGGAGIGSKGFLSIAADKALTARFVDQVVAYQARHNLDGIGIDWEYWTYQSELGKGGNDPVESRHLVDLLAALRAKLPKRVMLTVDIFAGPWIGDQYLAEIQNHADYVVLMAYDFTGGWPASPIGHHADLPTFKLAVQYALGRGFRSEKLIAGIPAYGIEFVDGTAQRVKRHDYRDILAIPGMDPASRDRGQYGNIYFETPDLVQAKSKLVMEHNLAGVVLFEISGDTSEAGSSLMSASNGVIPPKACP